jgi:hypothetical protein
MTTAQGTPGFSGPDPNQAGSYLYVGPDGQLYDSSQPGQEATNTPSQGNYATWAANNPAPGASALAQPSYNQAPAQQNPTYAQNTQLGTQNVSPALQAALSPQAAESLTMQGAAPGFQQQDNLLQQELADAGIVGGPTTTASDQLAQSQMAGLAPALAGEVQNSQNNLLSAAGTGSGYQQQTGLSNAATANTANAANVNSVNSTNQGNTAAYNTQQQQLMNMLAQMYSQQSAANTGAISQGQSGSNAIATGSANNFQVPSSNGTGGLTAALGQNYAAQTLAGGAGGNSAYSNTIPAYGSVGENTATASYA